MAPPEEVERVDDAISVEGRSFTHGDLVRGAIEVADEYGIEAGDAVGLNASLDSVGALVAGVLAPLAVGATVVPVPADDGLDAVEADLSLVVGAGDGRDVATVDPETVDRRF